MKKNKLSLLFLLGMIITGISGCNINSSSLFNSTQNNSLTNNSPTSSKISFADTSTSNDKTISSCSSSSKSSSSIEPSNSIGSSSCSVNSSSLSTIVVPDNIDGNVRLEGEEGIVSGNKLEVQNSLNASGGKFVAGINDCGQGLFFIHYAPIGGVHDVEIGYFTAYPNSKHELVVNGVAQTIVYTENTGWGDSASSSSIVTVQADFKQGYNVITLSKKGTANDNPEYGGWAQVDYIEIKGFFEEFDKENLIYDLDQIKVEAELGNYNSGATCPVGMNEASNGYIIGEINDVGHGGIYKLNLPETGLYKLHIAYAKDNGERPININFDGVNYEYSLEDYDGQAWNNFHLSETTVFLDFTEGEHTLSITRADNSNWFCFDYFLLTKIS